MKKYLNIIFVLLMSITLVGCNNNEKTNENNPNGYIGEENNTNAPTTITCKLEKEDTANAYKLVTTYELTVENDLVTKNKMKEVVTSSKEETLDYFKNYMETTYKTMNEKYGGHEYKVTTNNNQVIANTTIDYNKTDMKKIIEDDSSMKLMVNEDNKVTLSGLKEVYETIGITCEE